jgi:ComF family protein
MFEKIFPFFNAIYPDLCIACDHEHPVKGSCFCVACIADLPFANLHLEKDNIVEKFFWGRLLVERGTALFYFQKGELVQDMIHRLKYKNQGYIGKYLGNHFGEILKDSNFLEGVDVLIPIPIHQSKRKTRNYNQSSLIAEGISSVVSIPVAEKILVKAHKTPSQTNKTREERLQNLKDTFKIESPEQIRGKHVLLLDDILTTGSTLEAAGSVLSDYECKVSVAVAAVGKY